MIAELARWLAARWRAWYLRTCESALHRRLETYCSRASRFITYRELREAERWIQRALKLHPRYPEALALMGRIRRHQGQLEEALTNFQGAVEAARESTQGGIRAKAGLVGEVALEAASCCAQLHKHAPASEQARWTREVVSWVRVVKLESPDHLPQMLDDPFLQDMMGSVRDLLRQDEKPRDDGKLEGYE
jgi:tetratricopeptide (TPR) repeat protein